MKKLFNTTSNPITVKANARVTKLMAVSLAILTTAQASFAQKEKASIQHTPEHSLSLEVDPAAFIMKGYSFSARYSHKSLPHWSVMASVFAADFPNSMLSKANKVNGWSNLEFKCSKALFVDYHINKSGKGLFFGPSVFTYNNQAINSITGETVNFKTVYPNLRIGYSYFPFKKLNLYVAPWVNVGKEIMTGSKQNHHAVSFKPDNFKYIMALHIGYRYSFDKIFKCHNKKNDDRSTM